MKHRSQVEMKQKSMSSGSPEDNTTDMTGFFFNTEDSFLAIPQSIETEDFEPL